MRHKDFQHLWEDFTDFTKRLEGLTKDSTILKDLENLYIMIVIFEFSFKWLSFVFMNTV